MEIKKDENLPVLRRHGGCDRTGFASFWCLPLVYPPRVLVWRRCSEGISGSTSEEEVKDLDKKTRVHGQAWPERDGKCQGDTFERLSEKCAVLRALKLPSPSHHSAIVAVLLSASWPTAANSSILGHPTGKCIISRCHDPIYLRFQPAEV